jgi:hypothetical protein
LLANIQPVKRRDQRIHALFGLLAAIAIGNWVVVRAEARMAQQRADGVGHALRQQMFKFAGVGFALFQGHSQHVHDQAFGQAMTADDLACGLAPKWRQLDLAIRVARQIAFAEMFSVSAEPRSSFVQTDSRTSTTS